jgi:hypothetical protein
MTDLFRTLVITSSDVSTTRNIAASFGPGGVGMWTTPLSVSGADPASHYISSGYISEEFVNIVPYTEWAKDENNQWISISTDEGDASTIYSYTSEFGLDVSLSEIQGIFSRSDVSSQEPFVHIERMGLKFIQSEINI